MKNEVLNFLRNLPKNNNEKFNKAFEFLRAVKGTNFNQMRVYNMQGASESNIKNIIYDLKKHYGISDAEVLSKKSPIPKVVYGDVELKSVKNVDILSGTEGGSTEDTDAETKTNLHAQFPFLSAENCPLELHIVTGQLVASWKRYNAFHAELQLVTSGEKVISPEDLHKLTADCNAAFELNDKLYKELEHYRDNNAVLGEVEALKEYAIKKEIDAMSTEDLVKYKSNSVPYLSKAKKALIKDNLSDEKKQEISERIADREFRLNLVNQKLKM